jgi:hypothetical protein
MLLFRWEIERRARAYDKLWPGFWSWRQTPSSHLEMKLLPIFTLNQANLSKCLFPPIAKVSVGFLLLTVLWVHSLAISPPVD